MTEQEKTDSWYENEYLKSEHWAEITAKRKQMDGWKCAMCGSDGTTANPLEVHHWGYKHLWNEDVESELITLCHCCHQQIHRMLNRQNDRRIKNPKVPNISVHTITGREILYREEWNGGK